MLSLPRITTLLLFVSLIGLALAGCVPSEAARNADGGTLTRAMTSEPASLDPQSAANSGLSLVLPYVFDTLVTRQRDGNYTGLLAESWKVSPDGKTIDLKLRPGVKFHDGSKLDATAVVFTFERFKEAGTKSPIFSDVKALARVEAVDELTARFTFNQPTATFWYTLSMPYAAILSPSAVKAAGGEMGRKPVGTGPFRLKEWKPGVSITLARNPDYNWGPAEVQNRGPVAIDRLVFKVLPDASTQLAALRAGEVDVIFITEPSQVAQLRGDTNVRIEPVNLDALVYLGYNCARPPFDDVRVRQALSHAVDKNEIVKTALAGIGTVADTPLPPEVLGFDPSLKADGQDYDPARTGVLLRAAGFVQTADGGWQRDGKKLAGKLLTSTRAPNEAIATLLQSQFKAVGIPVEIQQLDSAAAMSASIEGGFDLLLWRHEWGDPDALRIYLGSSQIRQTNRVFYTNPAVDALLERGQREFDTASRARAYEEAQKLILADAPWQPLYSPDEAMVVRNRVQGLSVGSLGRMLVNDVTLSWR